MEEINRKIKLVKIDMPISTYYVEVIDNGAETEFWLYKENYGIKSLMFGLCGTDMSNEKILEIIDNNIISHIKTYREEYEEN